MVLRVCACAVAGGLIRVALVMMGVCKSPDPSIYEISSISSKMSTLRDSIRALGQRQRWGEEEMDDCKEPQRQVKRNSLHQSTHWLSGQTAAMLLLATSNEM